MRSAEALQLEGGDSVRPECGRRIDSSSLKSYHAHGPILPARERSDSVKEWLMGLADLRARTAVVRRIDRVSSGNFGDHKSVGDGISELRIDAGPGHRVYCAQEGKVVVLLLCAGSKRSQRADIERAKAHWAEHRERHA